MRKSIISLENDFEKSEDDIKALQSVGQIIGEVLRQLPDERCMSRIHPIAVLSAYLWALSHCQIISWTSLRRWLP